MSINGAAMMTKFNNLIGDNITSTTTSIGNAGGTTFVDSEMCKYPDGYFGDPERNVEWWAYIGTTLRPIKSFSADTGTFMVYTAFGSQVASSTPYELHRFDRDQKVIAINQALFEAYPYFYKRVEDETTLDGKGSSDNKYTVPATFAEFPDQIKKKHTSDSKYTYTPITDFTPTEISGVRYFYADITLDDDILLVGKAYLTQFTTDVSTTELDAEQAQTICYLAASILYRNLSGRVNASDSGRYDSLAARAEAKWDEWKITKGMPRILPENPDWSWTE